VFESSESIVCEWQHAVNKLSSTAVKQVVENLAKKPPSELTAEEKQILLEHFQRSKSKSTE
jgi:transposase